jgi:type II secretory pathway component PulF
MQRGCDFLSRYFARLDAVRRQIIRKAVYPLLMLHIGVVLLSLPRYLKGNPDAIVDVAFQLGSFYLAGILIYLFAKVVSKLGTFSTTMDSFLGLVPLIGGIRRSLALSRFCTTYQMQLDAGVNVMDSLDAAGRASASARIRRGIRRSLPQIRAGQAVGQELAKTGALPTDLMRTLVIGEQTGTLDADLASASAQYEAKALRGIDAFGEWAPRIIYFAILGFLAWNVISAVRQSVGQLNEMMEGMSQ